MRYILMICVLWACVTVVGDGKSCTTCCWGTHNERCTTVCR
jgi:hypothetical protein